ncbi:LMBR1-like membrane protein-domain-containing protein [Radiomyces spectabilis]|uniref:LMBR1-like membrane protein-domain-containing protein n=1 Tax=Radiomyces spectabilis TaxID=64574 RepID=UPI00221F4190|nr:LMBR1-like membrane protein-domain-containing protein [Radiomyces spectabilis]KAI8373037.1 LMBR1-like membrane protein-domain-containing protein [Radiomyces spectabilis]
METVLIQQTNWVPLILATTCLLVVVIAVVTHYCNVKVQPWYVSVVCVIGWFFPFWIVLLLPLDLASTMYDQCAGECKVPFTHVSMSFLSTAWRTIYWTSFCLTWMMIPMMQAYVNTGDFTVVKRIRAAFHVNIRFYMIYVVVGFIGLVYLIFGSGYTTREKIQGFVMAMANSWGLLLVIVFMGYGLVAVPRKLWFHDHAGRHLKQLYANAVRLKEECIDSELEFNEVAKTMNTISQQNLVSDPYMRKLVEKMVHRFPFVLHPDYVDRDRSITIPRTMTEEYLIKLNRRMILAARMKDRKLALWKNLLNEAFYLQDIIKNKSNLVHEFHTTVRPLQDATTWNNFKSRSEWWWVIRIRPIVYRVLAVLLGTVSVCILWSELTFNVQNPVISIVSLALKACGGNYAAVEIMAFLTLMYMCICVYTSLFKIRFFNLYILIPNHHTDENSLLWFTGYMCKMMAPLCYNYINLSGNVASTNSSIFSQFMGHAELIPFLGTTFNDWFPIVILMPALAVFFNLQGRCLAWCGVKDIYDDDDDHDAEAGQAQGTIRLDADAADGRALIDEERKRVEQALNPEIGLQRGLLSRARSALGAYTNKYGRPASPPLNGDLPSRASSSHYTPLNASLRHERDRRIDEILSGRAPPTSSLGSAASSIISGDENSDAELRSAPPNSNNSNPLASFGDAVKVRLGNLFSKNNGQPANQRSPGDGSTARPRSQDYQSVPTSQGNRGQRVLGTVATVSSASGLPDEARSRSPSPNPFLRHSSVSHGQRSALGKNSSAVSPFARFEDYQAPSPSNIFENS